MTAPVALAGDAPDMLLSEIHQPDSNRACLHLMGDPPASMLLSRSAVGRLNFQPRVCCAPSPCIASRIGDVLTIEFDADCFPRHRRSHRKTVTPIRYRYELQAVPDSPDVVPGVLCTVSGDS